MKNLIQVSLTVFIVLVLSVGCRDKAAEKRIAELEGRIAEMEAQKNSAAGVLQADTATAEQKPEGPLPVLQFEETLHDFGTIKEGDVVEFTYKFKNVGESELLIQHAQGSCGCTVPLWSKDPVAPGSSGFITAKFDSKGKSGFQEKTVTVTANTWPKQTTLKFKANVLAKDAAPAK